MANGKLLRSLIKTGLQGDQEGFRSASEAVIAEEREKKHHLLANDLEKLLYGSSSSPAPKFGALHLVQAAPKNKDSGLDLIEVRSTNREQHDLVLSVDARSSFDEIIHEHNRAEVLLSHGLRPAQKLIFFGPPGCGKTLAAEVLANELSLPLVIVRLDSVISSFLGETASNLRKVFDYISKNPTVALFDEFDALAKDRGDSADHGELKRSVNAVLQMMDGYRGKSILIATTNYESLLDKAIWRRFDETLSFQMPDQEQIKNVLSLKLSGVRRNFDPTDIKIANLFKGMSHADIERVLRRAIKEMVLGGKEFLEKRHIQSAVSREHKPLKS
jgi:SpoVK/Ycf46/Vps4 family AAA+-type ATPase